MKIALGGLHIDGDRHKETRKCMANVYTKFNIPLKQEDDEHIFKTVREERR